MSKNQIQERIYDLTYERSLTADNAKRAVYTAEIRRLQAMLDRMS